MNIDHGRLDDLRRGRGPIQEHVVDEFAAGRLSRRDFIRRGTAVGLSMPLLGGILNDRLTATRKNATGVYPAITGSFLWNAAKT